MNIKPLLLPQVWPLLLSIVPATLGAFLLSPPGIPLTNCNRSHPRETTIPKIHDNKRLHFLSSYMHKLHMKKIDQEIDVNPLRNHDNLSISRRGAFLMMASTFAAATTFPNLSIALDEETSIGKDTLQDVTIGKGVWTDQNESHLSQSSVLSSSLNIPTNFVTYMTRFLINYDTTISGWWDNDVLLKYKLLGENPNSKDKYNQQLDSKFSSLAKSIELSILDYVYYDSRAGPNQELDNLYVKNRFESLLTLFMNSYTTHARGDDKERMSQIMLLFTMLPAEIQPVQGLNKVASKMSLSEAIKQDGGKQQFLDMDFNKNQTKLLPINLYSSKYDPSLHSYTISPSIPNESYSSLTLQDELFGSIASAPLKRQRPNLSFNIYSLLGLCGAAGCALTHSLVIPFDVVKTKLQTNPNQYKNLIDGVISISKEETGMKTFLLGSQATIVGYFWYGLSVYPCYTFSKWYLENILFDPAIAVVNINLISLIAGAIAAVVASIGLTPIEAARIRTVAEPKIYRDLGLVGTLQTIAQEDLNLGWKTLYAGFPSLVTRQGETYVIVTYLNR